MKKLVTRSGLKLILRYYASASKDSRRFAGREVEGRFPEKSSSPAATQMLLSKEQGRECGLASSWVMSSKLRHILI